MYHSHCTYKFYQSLVLLLFFLRNLFLFYENETVVNLWSLQIMLMEKENDTKFPLYYPHPIIYNIVKAPRAAGRSEGELKFTTPGG